MGAGVSFQRYLGGLASGCLAVLPDLCQEACLHWNCSCRAEELPELVFSKQAACSSSELFVKSASSLVEVGGGGTRRFSEEEMSA